MTDNNIEEKDILEEEEVNEESIEANDNELESIEESTEESKNDSSKTGVSFIKSFCAAIIDNASVGVIAVILLYAFDFLLGLAGYGVSQKMSMLFIIFVIVSIFYYSICESSKSGKTIGKKLFKF
ncbi:hypothetical protein HMPREF1982_03635 [Clostridiales bacterium oral taxon 876 str. F0540]|nr:hypothetical protein HMPREF1982_03635 [Clostridiales bacterium oral taxon 876 str. F0540]